MRRLPSLKAVQAFEAAARLGSVAKAASELNVTASAVSHQIKFLEAELGVQLFTRVHRSIVLTTQGRRYADELGMSLTNIEEITRLISRHSATEILSVHSAPTFAVKWLLPRIGVFKEMNPDIDLRLHTSTNRINLMDRIYDVGIRYGSALEQPGIVYEPFPTEAIEVLCAPRFLKGKAAIRRPTDLPHLPLIHSELNLYNWRDWHRDNRVTNAGLEQGLRFDRAAISIEAAVAGWGVCLESTLLVQGELRSGTLVRPFGGEARIVCHGLMYLKHRSSDSKVGRFRNFLKSTLYQDDLR